MSGEDSILSSKRDQVVDIRTHPASYRRRETHLPGRLEHVAEVIPMEDWKQTPLAKEKAAWQTRCYVATPLSRVEEEVYTRDHPYIHLTPPAPHDAVLIGTGHCDEQYWGIFALPSILRSHLSSRFEDITDTFTMRLVFHRKRAHQGYGVTLPFDVRGGLGFLRVIESDTTRDDAFEGVMQQLAAQDPVFTDVLAPKGRPRRICVRAISKIDKFTVQMRKYDVPYP